MQNIVQDAGNQDMQVLLVCAIYLLRVLGQLILFVSLFPQRQSSNNNIPNF